MIRRAVLLIVLTYRRTAKTAVPIRLTFQDNIFISVQERKKNGFPDIHSFKGSRRYKIFNNVPIYEHFCLLVFIIIIIII